MAIYIISIGYAHVSMGCSLEMFYYLMNFKCDIRLLTTPQNQLGFKMN